MIFLQGINPKKLVFFAALFVMLPVWSPAAGESAAKPNIIFILSDDLAQGDLGCYGQKLIKTPRLDRMAAEGVRYNQAYSGTSVCAPSRSSLMTGLHMGHCPIRANREIKPEGQMPLPAQTLTVAQLLKENGYATACTGKRPGAFRSSRGVVAPWRSCATVARARSALNCPPPPTPAPVPLVLSTSKHSALCPALATPRRGQGSRKGPAGSCQPLPQPRSSNTQMSKSRNRR